MRRFPSLIVATAVLAVSLAALAQVRVESGRRLDASLQLGSGGYNRGVSQQTLLARQGYSVGSSRNLYVVSGTGEMRYSPNNAFNPRSRYTATGYRSQYSMTGRSSASLSRFRGY